MESAESKNQKTIFRVPLISSTNDSWEDFFGIDFLPMADKSTFRRRTST
jgi:hypothetical protein